MALGPFGASSPLFFRNGQILGLSPIHIIEYTEENNIPGILLFADFEQAFDSLNLDHYIAEILNLFNFGQDLKSWVNLFYKRATVCVLYNGYTT